VPIFIAGALLPQEISFQSWERQPRVAPTPFVLTIANSTVRGEVRDRRDRAGIMSGGSATRTALWRHFLLKRVHFLWQPGNCPSLSCKFSVK
jgi:hypothetical protein